MLLASESQPTPSSSLILTFTPSDWDVPQLVTASAPDNGFVDGDRTVPIAHTLASTDIRYGGLASTILSAVKDAAQQTAAYWKAKAAARIDISGARGGLDGKTDLEKAWLRNLRINAAYAELFRANNTGTFYWMGLAAYASHQVGIAMKLAADYKRQGLPGGTTAEANGRLLGDGNKAVYDDLYWQHLAYAHGGIALMRQFKQQNQINQAQLDAWEKIADGKAMNNQDEVWEGNRMLLEYEQKQLLQLVTFDHLDLGLKWADPLFNIAARSPVPRGKGFTTYFIEKKTPLNKLFEQHLLKNVDDRWDWIQGAVWVDWKAFLAKPLNRLEWGKFLDDHLPEAERQYFGPQP